MPWTAAVSCCVLQGNRLRDLLGGMTEGMHLFPVCNHIPCLGQALTPDPDLERNS